MPTANQARPTYLRNTESVCARCQSSAPAYAHTVVGVRYAYPTDTLMHALKSKGQLALAPMFARLLCRSLIENSPVLPQIDVIVPIPSSRSAIVQRGFNPAGEIARHVARQLGLPCRRTWLIKNHSTERQKRLDEKARQRAVEHMYTTPGNLPPVWVGLVDDVMTTGSTMHQAAQALLAAGAQGVVALAAMRAPRLVWHNTQHV